MKMIQVFFYLVMGSNSAKNIFQRSMNFLSKVMPGVKFCKEDCYLGGGGGGVQGVIVLGE